MTAIVWYRDDLRISDHPALHAAAKTHAPIVCIYVLDDRAPGVRSLGGATRWWLAQSLRALQESLRERGASLVLRQGSAPKVIAALAREIGADSGVLERDRAGAAPGHGRSGRRRAECDRCRPRIASPATCWRRRTRSATRRTAACACSRRSGGGCRRWAIRRSHCLRRRRSRAWPNVASDRLEDWKLEPTRPDWAGGLRDTWQPGEASAQARLKAFLEGGIAGYSSDRDRPDRDGTSRLSPHLRFGEISPRQVWHAARFAAAEHPAPVRRYRQIPQRTRLARILPASAVRRPRSRRRATCSPRSTTSPGSTMPRPCAPGSAA